MRKDKILFIFKRCEYNDNKVLILKNLSFLPIISFIIITRSLKSIVKNKSNENISDINFLKDIKKRLISIFKAFKKRIIQKFNLFDITEIDASTYYFSIRNKKNKLFSLTINKIYDTLIKFFEVLSSIKRNNYISINDLCLCDFRIKYKRYYKSYTSKSIQINNIKILISQKMLSKLFIDYHNNINVFNKS